MKDFVKLCIRTEAPITTAVSKRLLSCARLLHAMMGMQTEPGEFTDALKKHIYYGAPLDVVNLKEEAADQLWYVGLMCDVLGCTLEELQEMVISKLQKRFPDKFTEEAAITRDLDAERSDLEKWDRQLVDEPGVGCPDITGEYIVKSEEDAGATNGTFLVLHLDHPDGAYKYAACLAAQQYRKKIQGIDPKAASKIDNKARAIIETMPPLKRPKENELL